MLQDDLDYADIATRFKAHVKARDRWFRMKLYKNCFIASKAVNFLVDSGIARDREEATKIGFVLQVKHNLIRHVSDDHQFKDQYLFFRYNSDYTLDASTTSKSSTVTTPKRQPDFNDNHAPDPIGTLGFARSVSNRSLSIGSAPGSGRRLTSREAGKQARAALYAKEHKLDLSMMSITETETLMPQEKEMSDGINDPFETTIQPTDMRCLALVAHNHMKPAMKAFIEDHSEIIKKFRLTGTNTTMTMCKTLFGADDPDVVYGPLCTSGPLGGDAQLCALMCLEEIGAIIFFMDPLSSHPHQADIDSLVRLANVHNVLMCTNPATGYAAMWMLRNSLVSNRPEMIPSFFETLESPSVPEYKAAQQAAVDKALTTSVNKAM
jgi:methylglyoxal synthase